jgi:hypothetical protein
MSDLNVSRIGLGTWATGGWVRGGADTRPTRNRNLATGIHHQCDERLAKDVPANCASIVVTS